MRKLGRYSNFLFVILVFGDFAMQAMHINVCTCGLAHRTSAMRRTHGATHQGHQAHEVSKFQTGLILSECGFASWSHCEGAGVEAQGGYVSGPIPAATSDGYVSGVIPAAVEVPPHESWNSAGALGKKGGGQRPIGGADRSGYVSGVIPAATTGGYVSGLIPAAPVFSLVAEGETTLGRGNRGRVVQACFRQQQINFRAKKSKARKVLDTLCGDVVVPAWCLFTCARAANNTICPDEFCQRASLKLFFCQLRARSG